MQVSNLLSLLSLLIISPLFSPCLVHLSLCISVSFPLLLPLPAGSNRCGRKWRAKCHFIAPSAPATSMPVSWLTPSHSFSLSSSSLLPINLTSTYDSAESEISCPVSTLPRPYTFATVEIHIFLYPCHMSHPDCGM